MFIRKGQIKNTSALVQIMAWNQTDEKQFLTNDGLAYWGRYVCLAVISLG